MGNTLAKSTLQWGNMFGQDPIAHGSPAEALWINAMDKTQLAALWATIPHYSVNCIIPRDSTVYVPVVVPAFCDRLIPAAVAAGDGKVYINNGFGVGFESEIDVTVKEAAEDAGKTKLEQTTITKGGQFQFSTDSAGVTWVAITCDADVRVFGIGFIFQRNTMELSSAV